MSDERKRIPGSGYEIDRQGQMFKIIGCGHYPKGYQKKPQLQKGRIIYFDDGRKRDAQAEVLLLFGRPLRIENPRKHFTMICRNMEKNNQQVRDMDGFTPRKCKSRPYVKPKVKSEATSPLPKSVFKSLSSPAGYAAAVGMPASLKEGATLTSYCPFL